MAGQKHKSKYKAPKDMEKSQKIQARKDLKDYTHEDRKEFLDSLTSKNFKDLQQFISKIPALQHEIKYINNKGEERTRVLRGLFDFFTFV